MPKHAELVGLKFTRLTVVKQAPNRGKSRAWECVCDCDGKSTIVVRTAGLIRGTTRSCGCARREFCKARTVDHTGKVYGRWTVLHIVPTTAPPTTWMCQCVCGTVRAVAINSLVSGLSVSCGCYKRDTAGNQNRTHGLTESPEYSVWCGMMRRCYNKNEKKYADYGGRGIQVCDRWRLSFESFLADMGNRPSPGMEIDRKDNDGNYEPGNCRWITHKENVNNKRSNHMMTLNGKTQSMAAWSEELGMNYSTIRQRSNSGWSDEEALTAPLRKLPK